MSQGDFTKKPDAELITIKESFPAGSPAYSEALKELTKRRNRKEKLMLLMTLLILILTVILVVKAFIPESPQLNLKNKNNTSTNENNNVDHKVNPIHNQQPPSIENGKQNKTDLRQRDE